MAVKQKDDSLRNNEYYGMQPTFDKLYTQSKSNIVFDDLMPIIASESNTRLAYRNIKNNGGSLTSGVDKKTIKCVKDMKLKDFIKLIQNKMKNYQPQKIRRVEIPKSNGKTRPLGIPTIIDRIVQQCILQVLEPIMEAKFHTNSNGFRPHKSCESAVAQFISYIYRNKCYYVIDFDIKGFFDNVDHAKLIKQLWNLKIRDKRLLKIISLMLKAEIKGIGIPEKGTPQGGILSPLLANVVLNELDWWLSNQWMTYHCKYRTFKEYVRSNGNVCTYERTWLRKNTKLKEFYFVRYADDFKIICKSMEDAVKLKIAVTMWLKERLGLEVSSEKTKIVNLKTSNSDFLGFKIKVRKKSKNARYTITSHISDKAKRRVKDKIKNDLKDIRTSKSTEEIEKSINQYNKSIIGIHNYYSKATNISEDMTSISNELYKARRKTLRETIDFQIPNKLDNGFIYKTYGRSKQLIELYGVYIVPIAFVQYKIPKQESNDINKYSELGRIKIHTNLECMNYEIIKGIASNPFYEETVELNDVIIPRLASQYGKCYVSEILITKDNISFALKNATLRDKYSYQNVVVIDKDIKGLLLSKGCGIMELKKILKKGEQ